MGSTKPKPIKYYGLWWSHPQFQQPAYAFRMGVTSFSRNPRTELVMAHGTELPVRASTHHRTDNMYFYLNEESMNRCVKRANSVYMTHTVTIQKFEQKLAELRRSRKLAVDRELNRHAIHPQELEVI